MLYGSTRGGRQSFSVDADSRWVNRQPEATIVSSNVHTTSYAAYRQWVIDNWCYGYLPQQGDTVIDVGAGVGEEAVVFSHLVGPSGRVISIEAHPEIFSCLEQTISRSGLMNVIPLQVALAEADGTLTIEPGETYMTNSVVVKGNQGIAVPARALDSLADELGLADIGLIKMNIEGAERLAVRGMPSTAPRIRNLCISCHDFLADDGHGEEFRTKSDVLPVLEGLGFTVTSRTDDPEAWVRDCLHATRAA